MTKTIKNNKKIKNKTRRNNKREFIKEILKKWKTITGGCYEKDKTTIYKGDYYLSFDIKCNFYNHIHLILNDMNDIKYVMKKMDKDNKIVHSQRFKINVLSHPKKIVNSMIKNFKDFNKL
jgi:hypothetical protein